MMNFVKINWPSIIVLLTFLAILVLLWKKGKEDTVKSIIYGLVCQAEQQFGSKSGTAKWALVWGNLYNKLPWIIRLLFTQKQLESYIEECVQLLKRQLSVKRFNLLTYNQEIESVIDNKITLPVKIIDEELK